MHVGCKCLFFGGDFRVIGRYFLRVFLGSGEVGFIVMACGLIKGTAGEFLMTHDFYFKE